MTNNAEKEKMAERFLEVLRDLKHVRKRVQDEAGYGDIDVFKLAELDKYLVDARKEIYEAAKHLNLELPSI